MYVNTLVFAKRGTFTLSRSRPPATSARKLDQRGGRLENLGP